MAVAIEVEKLSFAYGERKALDGVSFSVDAGEIFGLVGPNGGGKSTLFSILSTSRVPAQGKASIAGYDVKRNPSSVRQCIGVVFQAPALDKKLTVRENLLAHGYLYGLGGSSLRAKIDQALSLLRLDDRKEERVEKLSGGLQRRAEIAKGILHDPQVLLMDEPTNGLDPVARRELWEHLTQLSAQKGMTILVTTHLMEEAERCHRILLLDKGRVIATGTPAALRLEMGGEVISLRSSEIEKLKTRIGSELGLSGSLIGSELRLEAKNGPELVTKLMNQYSDDIESVTLGKPTLEDFFIAKTGTRLSEGGKL